MNDENAYIMQRLNVVCPSSTRDHSMDDHSEQGEKLQKQTNKQGKNNKQNSSTENKNTNTNSKKHWKKVLCFYLPFSTAPCRKYLSVGRNT